MTAEPHILLDATAIPESRGGVGRYVDGIVPALVEAGVELTVACQPYDVALFEKAGARAIVTPRWARSTPGRLLWEQVGLPLVARRLGADVIHSVHYTFPVLSRRARVVTVHDLTFFTHPELHTRLKARFFRFWIRAGARARGIAITPSQATADEYTRLTHAEPDSVVVAHLAVDSTLFAPPTAEAVADLSTRLGAADHGWIAFLGTLEPRKNVTALIEGYVAVANGLPSHETPPLLLAGGRGWDPSVGPALERAVAAGCDVRTLGYLPLDELSAFLGGSTLVAYPSLGEGFGLPVLEAMATGACVLTTRELSLPEVGGDAVEYTGTSAEEIADRLSVLLADPARRAELSTKALERSRGFSWAASALAHRTAYRQAVTTA